MNTIKCALQAGGIGIWKYSFLWREENRRTQRKTLRARTRTHIWTGNRTWATLVEGQCCHHCVIPAPLLPCTILELPSNSKDRFVFLGGEFRVSRHCLSIMARLRELQNQSDKRARDIRNKIFHHPTKSFKYVCAHGNL